LHQAFYKELKEKGKNPTKYYALLMFDGDSMGKWLGAENCKPEVKEKCLQKYHENFSTLLGDYGKEATAYLDGANAGKALGKTVYAGGDDFLGFINLAYLWETLKELRTLFEQKVNQKLEHYKKPEANLTFSAGVVIAHYKQPLQQIVELCRSQEKKAKEFGSGAKNALAVVVSKHAGDAVEFAIPWRWDGASSEAPSGAANMIDCILELREFFRKQQLSKNFIHTVGRLLESLEQNDPVSPQENKPSVAPIDMDKELLKSLFRYALKRNPEKGNPADSQKLETLLLTAWEAAGKNGASFIAMLQTIDFIERQL
jgi:CRISPR-associated protein Cmr2